LAALSQFFPYVVPYVPGCPDPVVEQAIRSVCIDFSNRTHLVQTLTPQDVVLNQQDYSITIPTDQVLSKVTGVYYEDVWLPPSSIEAVRSGVILRGSVGSAVVQTGKPKTYFQKTPNGATISLYPIPAEAITLGLAIRAAFAPSRTATVIPDYLYQYWLEEISAGVVARLCAMPGQPYSNPGIAGEMRVTYNNAVRDAGIEARTGQVAAASRVQPRAFVA